jgi:hypothetical protein
MVAWLLDRQASAQARDVEGKTPLDYAALLDRIVRERSFFSVS